MKLLNNHISLIITIILTSWFYPAMAQDPFLQKGSRDAREGADRLMQYYQQELGMQVEQAYRFRNKAEEFIIRRQKVQQSDLSVRKKLSLLQAISDQETAEMANILTLPQLRMYRRLKRRVQPVEVTVEEGRPGTIPDP